MPRSLTFNTDSQSPKRSFVNSLANLTPATPLEVTLGDSLTTNLFLVSSVNGAYDTRSGAMGYTIKVGVGIPGAVPTGGTFTLTFGGQTTAALAYNISAAALQTALAALSSIGANNVQVSGVFPAWDVQFVGSLGNAAQALITANPSLLIPNSNVDVGNEQIGSGAQNAIQSVVLAQQPVMLQTSWTPITNGWSGTLNFNTSELIDLFTNTEQPITPTLEVKLYDSAGVPFCVGSPQITIYPRVIDEAAIGDGPFTNSASGTIAIGNGTDNGIVGSLGLSAVPRVVLLTVIKPVGDLNLYATVVAGTITTAGFTFNLNGLTDAGTYVLHYALIF